MNKTKPCSNCKQPIDKKAVICPLCGCKQKKKNTGLAIVLSLLVVFVVIIFIVVVLGGDDSSEVSTTPTVEATAAATSEAASEAEPTAEVTEEPAFEAVTGTVGDWEITFTGYEVMDEISSGLLTSFQPDEGNKYVVVYLTVTNVGTEAHNFDPVAILSGSFGAVITYGQYSYSSSYLLAYEDELTYEMFNPLVTQSGILAYQIPESVINSGETLQFVATQGSDTMTVDLD